MIFWDTANSKINFSRTKKIDVEKWLHEETGENIDSYWASLVVQMVKNLPAMQKTRVLFLGWKDPLEKGMATHSSILAWRIPWTERLGGLQSMGHKESDTTE